MTYAMPALPCFTCGELAPARPGTDPATVFCGTQCYEAAQEPEIHCTEGHCTALADTRVPGYDDLWLCNAHYRARFSGPRFPR